MGRNHTGPVYRHHLSCCVTGISTALNIISANQMHIYTLHSRLHLTFTTVHLIGLAHDRISLYDSRYRHYLWKITGLRWRRSQRTIRKSTSAAVVVIVMTVRWYLRRAASFVLFLGRYCGVSWKPFRKWLTYVAVVMTVRWFLWRVASLCFSWVGVGEFLGVQNLATPTIFGTYVTLANQSFL